MCENERDKKMNMPEHCLATIDEIYHAWEKSRVQLIEEGRVYLVRTSDIVDKGHLRKKRHRDNALAPGKIKNMSEEDKKAGQAKYDFLRESIAKNSFDNFRPVSFVIRIENKNRFLHQGHHRVSLAYEMDIIYIPIIFIFDRRNPKKKSLSKLLSYIKKIFSISK